MRTSTFKPPISKNTGTVFNLNFWTLIFGVFATQRVVIGGEIYLGEMFALGYLIFIRIRISRRLRNLVLLAALWAFCQIISDYINRIAFADSLKGVGAPVLFMITICGFTNYFGKHIQRLPSFLLGMYLGMAIELLISPNTYFSGNPWKWGIGQVVSGIFCVYFSFFTRRKVLILVLFLMLFFAVGLLNNSRGMAMFPVFAFVLLLVFNRSKPGFLLRTARSKLGIAKIVLILLTFIFFLNTLLSAILSNEWVLERLPEETAEKFQIQARGQYGILLGGRSELLISIDAFLAKPLFGHGSWAKDKDGYQAALATKVFELGYADNNQLSNDYDLIPVHSYIMGALVWAGIGGVLFWLYFIRQILYELARNSQVLNFYFYNGIVLLLWNIFFSPFGASHRWEDAIFVSALLGYCLAFRQDLQSQRS